MPQLSPMSWSVISLLVVCYFLVVCTILWWSSVGSYCSSLPSKWEVGLLSRGFGFKRVSG
uniref:ATP synthase F0 subunit 8 n=1 Tax=Margaritifera margaritifera TaxID=2505931 RepID=A0A4Y5QSG2_9BIVA|nr:ATP synthase F0 subunit 8 [Margaritifera margaritifera]